MNEICNHYLEEMREHRELTDEREAELKYLLSVHGCTREFHDFLLFLHNIQTTNIFENFDGVSVLQLFESYKQWVHLREVVGGLHDEVQRRLNDLGSQSRGEDYHEYYEFLSNAIDEKMGTVFTDPFHESRLNIDELMELRNALKVILTLSELNERHAFSCLYLLNHTEFDEYVEISNNNILNAILRDAGVKIEAVDPAIITSLNENHEHNMDELARIVRHLQELNDHERLGLNIVDTRIPVIPPNVARKCLEGEEVCAITLEPLKALPLEQKVMLKCGHGFTKSELKKWVNKGKKGCPTCREPIEITKSYKGSTSSLTRITPPIAKALVEGKQSRGKTFVDPVVLHCGHVVDKSEMDSRFARNAKTCPKCGKSATEYVIPPRGGSRKRKRNGRGKSKKLIKRKKTMKRR